MSGNIEELLKSLQRDYLTALPDKFVVIRKQIEARDTMELRESFHKLKGTGKTYGIPEVSEVSQLAEQLCLDFPDRAVEGARYAVEMLESIHAARAQGRPYPLEEDSSLPLLQKLLQS